MSNFVGLRLHVERDADIIKDLAKYKDVTARVKEVYRRAVLSENQTFSPAQVEVNKLPTTISTINPKTEAITWSFPDKPSVALSTTGAPSSLKAKLLSNGF